MKTEKKIQINDDEIKKIMLNIFIDVKSFLEENDLTYSLYYGTLLGAIRHKGFIPWDVDMDIVMPRPDYDYFIENYVPKNKNITMFDEKHNDSYHFAWAKICDNRTVCDEHYRGYKKNPYGIYLDIFPIEGVDENYDNVKRQKWAWRYMKFSCLVRLKPSSFFPFHYNVGLFLSSILFGWWVNPISLRNRLVKLCTKVDYTKANQVSFYANGLKYLMIVDKKDLIETIDGEFEGISCKIPKKYDKLLTQIYGDYMVLPPKDKRNDNHTYNSYYYKKDLKKNRFVSKLLFVEES